MKQLCQLSVASSQLSVASKDAALVDSALQPLQKQVRQGLKPKSLLARCGKAEAVP
jgi:hypothetical protein